jgi:hypothetical protein
MRIVLAFSLVATLCCFRPALAEPLAPGVWRSPGYGYVVQVTTGSIRTFDVTASTCVAGPVYKPTAFHGLYGQTETDAHGSVALVRFPTRDALERLSALPRACKQLLRRKDASTNIAVFTQTFAELYPAFAARGLDWNTTAARAKASAQADAFVTLQELVAPLNDAHVTLTDGKRAYDPDTVIANGAAPDGKPWTWRTLRSDFRDALQGTETPLAAPAALIANRRVMTGRIGADLAYIVILSQGVWTEGQDEETPAANHVAAVAATMDSILATMADANGLILDLRVNSGGFDAVSAEIASRFLSSPHLAYRKSAGKLAAYDVWISPSQRAV